MSDTSAFGFGKFVPGFDFLQNLGQAANPGAKGSPQGMPNMASWVAPTMNIEELDKRIQELKTVQFWLEQNTNALKATIQALEVQKMTLSTLQGMNVNMADLAKAFTAKMPDLQAGKEAPVANDKASPEEGAASSESADAADAANASSEAQAQAGDKPAVDPMQWWGAITQQFQNIAAAAVKDVAANAMKEAPQPVKKKAAAKKTSATGAKKASAAAKKTAAKKTAKRAANDT
jgi:hypothetical protein